MSAHSTQCVEAPSERRARLTRAMTVTQTEATEYEAVLGELRAYGSTRDGAVDNLLDLLFSLEA